MLNDSARDQAGPAAKTLDPRTDPASGAKDAANRVCEVRRWVDVRGRSAPKENAWRCGRPARWVVHLRCPNCGWLFTGFTCDRHRAASDCGCGGTLAILHRERL